MNRTTPIVVFLSLMALLPVVLAVNQAVPAGSVFKQVVLLLSLAAFGLVLGQFWLSRFGSRNVATVKPAVVLRWHKIIGYSAGGFLLIHPVLMIARRFWVLESDPSDNLLLMLRAPAMVPAIVAWMLLALLVVFAFVRRGFPAKSRRLIHGLVSSGFAAMAVWHVVTVGRHSSAAMSAFWIILAAGAVGSLLFSYRHSFQHARSRRPSEINGGAHEPA